MHRVLNLGLLVLLLWGAIQVSLRAVARAGSGRLAEIQAQVDEKQGLSPIASFQRAVQLSPREALYHSRLGLALEARGDLEFAEKELTLGTQLSRKYEPHWDLLNFYFRRGNWERFWTVVAEALPMSWGERAPLFELAVRAEGGQTRLQQVLPARREVRFNYAVFLITKGELASAAPYISELAASVQPEEKPTLLSWIDLLLQRRMVREALQVWGALGERGDPFPWRPWSNAGVTTHVLEDGWQILFNGNQPEHCILLESVKPVSAGVAYRLNPSLEEKLAPAGGLRWNIETLEAAPRPLEKSFTAPAGVEAVIIRLEYQRPPGSVRAEGEIRVRPVVLQRAN